MTRALLTLLTALLLASPALADAPQDPAGARAACSGLVEGKLCDLPDYSGGICAWAQCAQEPEWCLTCLESDTLSQTSDLWKAMFAFGVTVMLVGSFFWFRLNRAWNQGR